MKILMVCLGNICRSPLAEGILRHKIEQKKRLGWEVDSAGTGGWHAGDTPDRRSIFVAKKYGIDLSGQRARQIRQSDFDEFDRIFVMDAQNFQDVLALARTENHRKKVEMILNRVHAGQNRGVPDPYYGGGDGFETVFRMLDEACEAILEQA